MLVFSYSQFDLEKVMFASVLFTAIFVAISIVLYIRKGIILRWKILNILNKCQDSAGMNIKRIIEEEETKHPMVQYHEIQKYLYHLQWRGFVYGEGSWFCITDKGRKYLAKKKKQKKGET
ncbi:MAG: hypothetical protein COX80_01005 [Candidatus Magasanikbacteria bacterium CG_4_10_14_0_2_um_filter_33_14]|uniref:ArnR1-like winged helix-turn-helix domain-containing protein n=1 Tax=Candidatus Magasanikbacteria bacterium CG_4_10_14_0_2_um_filter_33_14 TaxID=1974636 RepID=A0A2M7VBM8_9BACT|nr:MAG: hypothetical protein COX80_01005 [Candidatus Magasanikbacteria bacterium CG_4_10_14_0_2_um_filter_33_14]